MNAIIARSGFFVLWLLSAALAPAQVQVEYALRRTAEQNGSGAFHVQVRATGLAEGPVKFALPAWKPGAYRLERWYRFVENVTAAGESGPLEVTHSDRVFWTVAAGHGGAVVLDYDMSTERFSESWMSCEGPATWMYLADHLAAPCRVRFELPEGWQIACGMDPAGDPFTYTAPDYDTMADCPIEMGKLFIDSWEVDGDRLYCVYNLEPRFDREAMKEMCTKIVRCQSAIFGGTPFEHYWFLWHLQTDQSFFGGLEHLNSTTLALPQFILTQSVEEAASLVAHEFFHLWNIKRVRPHALGPFEYSKKVPVRGLWMSEGVTDYYADVTCVRTGIWKERRYVGDLRGQVAALLENPGYLKESVEEASLAAFERDFMEGGLDYYNTGKILGLLLDIEIRWATKNEKSLDDVMRLLLERYGLPKPGFADADLIRAASEIIGRDMTEWFSRYVAGRQPLPFAETLARAGVDFQMLEVQKRDIRGFARMMPDVKAENRGSDAEPQWTIVEAGDSGFRVGDVVVAFGDFPARGPIGQRTFVGRNVLMASRDIERQGEPLPVKLRRGDETLTLEIAVPMRTDTKVQIELMEEIQDELVRRIQDALFRPAKAAAALDATSRPAATPASGGS